jgi:hypothetical protein
VGVRINIDVLNAQQQLFQTRRDLAVARYNTIVNSLRLKAVAGALREAGCVRDDELVQLRCSRAQVRARNDPAHVTGLKRTKYDRSPLAALAAEQRFNGSGGGKETILIGRGERSK